MSLSDDVRAASSEIAASARSVRIDLDALEGLDPGPPPVLDAERHYLEGEPEHVAGYMLALDAINFGSGWFPTLRKRRGADGGPLSGYFTVAWGLADRFRAAGPWTNAELRGMRTEEIADVLGQRRDHELMALFAQALRQLGAFLDGRTALDAIAAARGSAVRLAEQLAAGMPMFRDPGFYKRAQIVPSDLELAGVATFGDIDRLSIFADNLVPHVLRCDGVLVYDPALAAHIDSGQLLPSGRAEREIRACAVHACVLIARRTGMNERDVDNALWTRGGAPAYKAVPRHRTRTIFY
ncbi:MAG TPA: queuosine salvage family protein [Solirubrobacteraceae bacterium]|nr:queuosine salvage family protein [Solirubrobacteraceae bacterium]